MLRLVLATSFVIGATVAPAAAQAGAQAGPGAVGTFVLSVDRVFGLLWSQQTTDLGNNSESTDSNLSLSLVGQAGPMTTATSVYNAPRLNLDYLVTDAISVGAGVGFAHTTQETENKTGGTTVTDDGPSYTGFVFAPRAGYVHPLTDTLAIWPRGGLTYLHVGSDGNGQNANVETSLDLFGVTLDGLLLIMPAPSIAFTVGMSIEASLTGSRESTGTAGGVQISNDNDVSAIELGLQAGLAAWF